MHIYPLSTLERSRFSKIATLFFHALVALLKLLVSLISRPVACSARIVVDRQTDRQADTQNDYCNHSLRAVKNVGIRRLGTTRSNNTT